MRTKLHRGPLALAALMTFALLAPGTALAHGRHHARHHARRHHAHVSFVHLGPATTGPGSPAAPGTPPPAKPTGAAPTTPATPENAGKVASYTSGVLTLTLADGSTISGKVTAATRIECVSATPTPPQEGNDDEGAPGDDNGMGDDRNGGDRNQEGGPPWAAGQWRGGGDRGGPGDDDGQGDEGPIDGPIVSEPPCDTSALVEGAVVRAAELRIAPGGTEFEIIELVR